MGVGGRGSAPPTTKNPERAEAEGGERRGFGDGGEGGRVGVDPAADRKPIREGDDGEPLVGGEPAGVGETVRADVRATGHLIPEVLEDRPVGGLRVVAEIAVDLHHRVEDRLLGVLEGLVRGAEDRAVGDMLDAGRRRWDS